MTDDSEHLSNPSDSQNNLPSGKLLGKYRIVEMLGSGARGTVYRAIDTKLHRDVALKILNTQAASGMAVEEHIAEARAAASVNNRNIVTVYDAGSVEGFSYISMEMVPGQSLDALLKEGPLDTALALDVTCQLLEGLKATHAAGIIHRDIKPQNIQIGENGRVCLLDFGVSSSLDLPVDSGITGTLPYMSPEQLKSGTISRTTDLYAVGVVLYEMLTGFPPFRDNYDAALTYSIINQAPEPIATKRPDLPPALDAVISSLLAKKPEERYSSIPELLNELKVIRSGRGTSRWNGKVALALTALLAIASIVIYWFVSNSVQSPQPVESQKLAVLPFENRGLAEDAYFVNGVTDAITVRLSKLSGIKVISRSSVARLVGDSTVPESLGAILGAHYLLSGAVYRERISPSNQIRVDASLINTEDNTNIWAESYVYKLKDVFALQADIAEQITKALKLRVSSQKLSDKIPTSNLQAYDLFLRGNDYFYRSWNQDDLVNAVEFYQRAIALDSNFALAHAMLSRGHESLYWEYFDRTPARCSLAFSAASRALEIEPELLEGKLALAFCYYHCDQNYELALKQFDAVLKDWPNNSDLHSSIGAVLRRLPGLLEDALEHFKISAELDPTSNLKLFDVGLTLSMTRQYDSALVYLNRARLLKPDWELPYIYTAWLYLFRNGDLDQARKILAQAKGRTDILQSRYYWWLSRITEPDYEKALHQTRPSHDTAAFYLHHAQLLGLMQRHEEERLYSDSARVILERQVSENPDDPRYLGNLALAYAHLGLKEKSLAAVERATHLLPASRDAFDGLFVLLNSAESFVLLGMYDKAIDQIEQMLSMPGFLSVPVLKIDPLWKPLRDNPRFTKLLERFKTPPQES